MSDPLGLVGQSITPPGGVKPPNGSNAGDGPDLNGPSFKELLRDQISRVNELQSDAQQAIEDLAAGKRDDIEGVAVAVQKADSAFRLLLQVRNKVMDAYEEIKQVRV